MRLLVPIMFSRNPNVLGNSTEYRKEKLAKLHGFECKCKSCLSNIPPFQPTGDIDLQDLMYHRVFKNFDKTPNGPAASVEIVSVEEKLAFERLAIQFLESNEPYHPTEETLRIQFKLMQFWGLLGR